MPTTLRRPASSSRTAAKAILKRPASAAVTRSPPLKKSNQVKRKSNARADEKESDSKPDAPQQETDVAKENSIANSGRWNGEAYAANAAAYAAENAAFAAEKATPEVLPQWKPRKQYFLKGNYSARGAKKGPADFETGPKSNKDICWEYQKGFCSHGTKCSYSHQLAEEPKLDLPNTSATSTASDRESAGIRFIVDKTLGTYLMWKGGILDSCTLPVGPCRLRIVGNMHWLGQDETLEGKLHAAEGTDLFWEGDRWVSLVLSAAPGVQVKFSAVAVHQHPHVPGLLLGAHRRTVHSKRRYTWGREHSVMSPKVGEVVDIYLHGATSCNYVRPRYDIVGRPEHKLPETPAHAGRHQCYSFEDRTGQCFNFALYLPPGYDATDSEREWPMVIFLHSMHNSLDRDNNIFYESDTPLRLLHTNSPLCPKSLRDRCILLAPKAPEDKGCIWLRDGWFESSTHSNDKEDALRDVIECVAKSCRVDRRRISLLGSSMGSYCALELSRRWPKFFSAAGLAAAHYEIQPVGPLIERLAEDAIPLWFFHASNDMMCSVKDVQFMVNELRKKSKAEIKFTEYRDTWSCSGHHVDPVAWYAPADPNLTPTHGRTPAQGEELFEWLTDQRLA